MIFCISCLDYDTSQSAATIERRIPDTRYTFRNCYTHQSTATTERKIFDTRTACYNYFFQIFRNIIVVITIRTRTEYVPEMRFSATVRFSTYKRNSYTSQLTTTTERRKANTRYSVSYCCTRQSAATTKRRISDTRYTFRNCYTHQSAATIERRISDTRYTIWDSDTYQSAAIIESITTDTRTACYNYFFQTCRNAIIVITIKNCTKYISEMRFSAAIRFFTHIRNSYTCQSAATIERINPYTRYAFRNCYTCQSAATSERIISDTRYATIVRNNTILTT